MKKKLLFLLITSALLLALCFGASAAVHSSGSHYDERPLYPNDPLVKIVDGVAYEPQRIWDQNKREYAGVSAYHVIDFFATNKLAKTATEIRIVPEIDGVPVTAITARYHPDTRNETVKALTIPDSVTHIEQLFLFRALETVRLPQGLKTLGGRCFTRMDNLKEIDLPKELTAVPPSCFKGCKQLTCVRFLGSKMELIGAQAFYGCVKLEDVEIPHSVRQLQSGAFAKSGIRYARIPVSCALTVNRNSSGYTGEDTPAFYGCKQLEEVFFEGDYYWFPENIRSTIYIPHDTFRNCTALKKVTLPACRHLTIGENAFMNCKALETVTNGEFIEFAPAGAFRNCKSLKRFEIGNWADRIGADTFKGCTGLKKLILKTDNVLLFDMRYPRYDRSWNGNFLRGIPATCRIYVPNDTMQQAVVSHGFTGRVTVKQMRDLAQNTRERV